MSELPSFLGGGDPDEDTQAVVDPAPQGEGQPETSEGPQRGADGRFLPKADASAEQAPQPDPAPASAASPEPAPQVAPPAASDAPPPGFVPVSVVQELRQEIRALKEPQHQVQRPAAPDPDQDPEGFEAYQERQEFERQWNVNANWSEKFAVMKYGDDKVKAAFEWALNKCDTDPLFNQRLERSQDPYEVMVAEHQREVITSQFSDPKTLAAFQAWQAQQAGQPPAPAPNPAAPAANQNPNPTPPRPSIAAAPSAGGPAQPAILDGEGTFNRMFNR